MKSRLLVIASFWVLSLAAAYLIGSGTVGGDPDPSEAATRSGLPPRKSSRPVSPRSGGQDERRSTNSNPGLRIVASQPPRQAVMELTSLTDPVSRVQGFLALVDSLGPNEFLDVVKDFRTTGLQGDTRRTEYAILLHAWGQTDPQGALAYTIENTGTNFARQTVLSSWASYDPDGALAFAEANHTGDEANPLLVGVIQGLARDDMNRATSLLQTLPRSRERGDALNSLVPLLLADGVDSAVTWSNAISDETLRSGALTYIARDLSSSDPSKAAELVLNVSDQEAKIRAIDDIAESWAEQDLDAAIAFTEGLEPELQAEAAEGVVGELASKDPQEASRWMETLAANGTNLDPAIRSFVWNSFSKEPELAADWVGQMSSQRDSERTYHHILGRWMGNDPEAARAWMSNTELPESIQRRFAQQEEQK
jgi:hypothetical protein